ncbi:hypothetical protein SDJN03_18453, partial [Cucurbita argyrosperma subsp. sororia]
MPWPLPNPALTWSTASSVNIMSLLMAAAAAAMQPPSLPSFDLTLYPLSLVHHCKACAILEPKNSNISRLRILRTKGDRVDSLLAINPRIATSHTSSHAMFQCHETIPTMSRRTCQQFSRVSKVSSRSSNTQHVVSFYNVNESIHVQMKQ